MRLAFQCGLILLLWPAVALQAATTVTNIAAGYKFSLFLKSDGSLWGMGLNNYGQLGDGTFNSTNKPEEIVPNNIVAVAAGGAHSLFIKSDGSLWATGWNRYGQLGDGMTNNDTRPEEIVSNGVVAVAAGYGDSLFLKSDGSLWAVGYNNYGALGDGTTNDVHTPEEIVSNDVVAIAAGAEYSLFLKSGGSLWGMGDNYDGELGDGTISDVKIPEEIISNGVVAIAAGGAHSLFLKSDGSLWVMGWNHYGQLGDGTFNDAYTPEEIVSNDVMAVAVGVDYSLFLKSDGSLWGMGDNSYWLGSYGQLGDGTIVEVNTPAEIVSNGVVAVAAGEGAHHSLFIKSDGSLWGMGADSSGELGDGYASDSSIPEQIVPLPHQSVLLPPVLVANAPAPTVTNIAAGDGYSLFVTSDGSLWGIGDNTCGELGNATYPTAYNPEQIVSSKVVAVATGGYEYDYYPLLQGGYPGKVWLFYTLFLKTDGSLWAMGDNYFGELGLGTNGDVTTPEEIVSNNVVAVAAGAGYSLFVKTDGSLWGVGYNEYGQFGDGTNAYVNTPTEIVSNKVVAVAIGGGVISFVAGKPAYSLSPSHSLFLKSDGSLWGMGDNSWGELGDGTYDPALTPEEIVSNGVVAISAGNACSFFLKSDGSLWGMGNNMVGELGLGTNVDVTTPEEIVSNGVVAVVTGEGFMTYSVYEPSFDSVYAEDHNLFLKSDGSLWGMGYNGYGELGDGTTNDVFTPEEIVSNSVVAVAAGWHHSLFLKSDGSFWGMGDDSAGELGNGSSSSYSLVPVPGKLPSAWLRGACFAGGTYRLLSSTNVALPVSQWTPVWTNTIVYRRQTNFYAPLPDDFFSRDPQRFYLLQSQ